MISLVLAFTLMATAAPPPQDGGEPLPASAPSDSYELSAWCYGAMAEYLSVYEKVKPDLRDIDHMFGTSVVEDEPYQSDMAAARDELKLIGESVTAAEKASPRPIAPRGVVAMRQGQGIWAVAEAKTHRELARAWLSWALPDRCDSNARELAKRSAILGKALTYNNGPGAIESTASAPAPAPAIEAPTHLTAGAIGYVGATGVAPAPAPAVRPTPPPEPTAEPPQAALPPTLPSPDAAVATAAPPAAPLPTAEAVSAAVGAETAEAAAPPAPSPDEPAPAPPTPRTSASAAAGAAVVDEPQEPVL